MVADQEPPATDRHPAHQASLLNQRLQLALRSSHSGIWELDIAAGRLEWDDRMLEIYQWRREDFDGSRAIWSRRVHPDDLAKVEAVRVKALNGELADYKIDFRIVRPDGSLRFVEDHGSVQHDAQNRPIRLVGLHRDTTEERQMRDALKVTEQRWQLAIEGSNDAVCDWDLKTNVLYHNRHWIGQLG